nr:hypothetical protein [Tanacetum cinerariifolium]
ELGLNDQATYVDKQANYAARTFRVILFSIYSDEWKSFQGHHQTTLRDGNDKVIRVLALETGLKQTKKVYGAAYTKLIMKGSYEQDMKFDFDAAKEVSTAEHVFTAGAVVTTASFDISPASPTRRVSTADDITMVETLVYIKRSTAKTKDKAVRLQKEFDEEERQRIARVYEAAQIFTKEELENIRARVKADEELTQRLQVEERKKYSEVD